MAKDLFVQQSQLLREHLQQLESQLSTMSLDTHQQQNLTHLANQLSSVTKELEQLNWTINKKLGKVDTLSGKSA